MRLLLRADASAQIGMGHVMRCLALAQACHSQCGEAIFAMSVAGGAVANQLERQGVSILRFTGTPGSRADAEWTSTLARRQQASWVVIDGYQFDGAYQRRLRTGQFSVLAMDDFGHAGHYYSDLVVNQNIFAEEVTYDNREPHTRLLLGTRYALLRQEFLRHRREPRTRPTNAATNVLVTLGGADPNNITSIVLRAFEVLARHELKIRVVIGLSNPHRLDLERQRQDMQCDVELLAERADLPELMAWADIAITGAGATCWELAYMGLPMVTVTLAENQEGIAAGLAKAGAALSAGWGHEVSPADLAGIVHGLLDDPLARRRLAQRARKLVDGRGAQRVLDQMVSHNPPVQARA